MESRNLFNLPTLIYAKRVFEDIAPHVCHIQHGPSNQRDVTTHNDTDNSPQLSQFGVIHLGSHRVHRNSG
jgi:hypothetical protein